MSAIDKLIGQGLIDASGQEISDAADRFKGKVVGLYFSGHWCPPCRGFTPVLVEFYKNYGQKKNFEIIFISSDRDQSAFDEYYGEMPWLALKYQERKIKDDLSKRFNIRGIPTLILLDADSGEILCADARGKIQGGDVQGENFPWKE